ncbi:thymidine kinase [Bacillus anthracis]|nr:thymidine kinase [Bacillus anthracis]
MENVELTLIVGGMFSGKSSELQRQGKRHMLRGHKVLFLKPSIDTRYSEDEIVTHDGRKVKAENVRSDELFHERIGTDIDVVLIDEVQFFGASLLTNVNKLLRKGIRVYCAGLDLDFKGRPFGVTPFLMAQADNIVKLHAVCDKCGGDAWKTSRKNDDTELVSLGEKENYYPICRKCYYKSLEETTS